MNSKSLMIGDWVSYNDGLYKIKAVIGFGYTAMFEWNPIYWTEELDNSKGTVLLENIKPVPLTEEILKANGFDDEEGKRNYIIRTEFEKTISVALFDDGSVITISNSNLLRGINSIHICDNGYVHILQHALRICGLNELADNFKLTD